MDKKSQSSTATIAFTLETLLNSRRLLKNRFSCLQSKRTAQESQLLPGHFCNKDISIPEARRAGIVDVGLCSTGTEVVDR